MPFRNISCIIFILSCLYTTVRVWFVFTENIISKLLLYYIVVILNTRYYIMCVVESYMCRTYKNYRVDISDEAIVNSQRYTSSLLNTGNCSGNINTAICYSCIYCFRM